MLGVARRAFTAQITLPLFWAVKRLPVMGLYRQFRQQQWDDVSEFYRRRDERLRMLLTYALTNVPFYSHYATDELLKRVSEEPRDALTAMPILEKRNLREAVDQLYVDLGRGTTANSSGGSTGEPVKLYQDREFNAHSLAATMLMYEWAGVPLGCRAMRLWGAERDLVKGGKGWKQRLIDMIGNRYTINAFNLSPERMLLYAEQIVRYNPVVLVGYAESLYELAIFIQRNDLAIASPMAIVSSAGTLHAHMRAALETVFCCEVFDRYGGREGGNVAAECQCHSGLHVQGETTFVEVVDENGVGVKEGQEGEILITNLWNFTMPLIRYRVGDRAVLGGGACRCGRPYERLERIVGRSGGSFRTRDGGVVSPEFFIHLVGVMCNDGTVGRFQVVQEDYDKVVVRVVPAEGKVLADWTKKCDAVRLIKKVMGPSCRVEIRREAVIEATPTGKHLYTVSELETD